MDATTTALVDYATGQSGEPLPLHVCRAAKRHLIDSVACALGALDSRPARVARSIAGTASSRLGASVFGLEEKTTPEYAAFANTVMIRHLDYNDTGNGGHPSDMIPAALALAEPLQASGDTLLRAIHVEYETVAALRRGGLYGDALRKRHIDQVWTVLGGVLGASVILGLDRQQTAHAIAIALTPNIPLRVARSGMLSDWKGCATAHCAMMAVFAARLAKEGLTGPEAPFAGISGFNALLGLPAFDLSDIGQPVDGMCAIESTGLKAYPADYNAQGPISALLRMRAEIRVEDIESMTIAMHWGGWHAIGGGAGDHQEKWRPATRETADHSMPYLAAVALIDGDITLASFAEERLADPALHALMDRITVIEDGQLTRAHAGVLPNWPSRIEIRLRDGQHLRHDVVQPRGHPLNPLSDEDIEGKFRNLCPPSLSPAATEELLGMLHAVERLHNVAELTRLFRSLNSQRPA